MKYIENDQVLDNFKPLPLAIFVGKSDPQEHILTINTKTDTIRATNSLKSKMMEDTLKDAPLRWYMSLPKFSITSY